MSWVRTPKTPEPVQPPSGEPDRELRMDPMASANVVPRKQGAHYRLSYTLVRVRLGYRHNVLMALQSERQEHTGGRAHARFAQHVGHFHAVDRGLDALLIVLTVLVMILDRMWIGHLETGASKNDLSARAFPLASVYLVKKVIKLL